MVSRSRSVEPGRGGARGELVDLRPGALGVDVVGGQRRDAAPVVDARARACSAYSASTRFGGACTRIAGPSTSRVDRDRGGQLVQVGVRHAAHRGVRLGAEVLDDDLLDAAVLAGDPADREDRLGPLLDGLADADEDAGGERHVGPARRPPARAAVPRGPCPASRSAACPFSSNSRREVGLQHHAHRRRDRLEPLQVPPGHDARVEVRQQAGLLQHPDRHRAHVGERVVVAVRVEPLAGLVPAVLGPVAEGEQRLLAAQRRALPGDLEHLVRG